MPHYMSTLELAARSIDAWPSLAQVAVIEAADEKNGVCFFAFFTTRNIQIGAHGKWEVVNGLPGRLGSSAKCLAIKTIDALDPEEKAVITEAQWKKARAFFDAYKHFEDEGWTLYFGQGLPVDPADRVYWKIRSGRTITPQNDGTKLGKVADALNWDHDDDPRDIIAYMVVGEEKKPDDWRRKGELPPVGTMLDFLGVADNERSSGSVVDRWERGDRLEVVAHKAWPTSSQQLAVVWNITRGGASPLIEARYAPEGTVSDEDRYQEIKDMAEEIRPAFPYLKRTTIDDLATYLHTQGYRKKDDSDEAKS